MELIAIVGKKRVGKDTAAETIAAEYENSVIYKLATPIKEVLFSMRPAHLYGLTYDDFDGAGCDREAFLTLTNDDAYTWIIRSIALASARYGGDTAFANKTKALRERVFEIGNKNGGWSIRTLMTTLGTDIMVKMINPLFWCSVFVNEYMKQDKPGVFIVTDVRQPIEIALMREMNARIIHITRETGIKDGHSTERGLEKLDSEIEIINNGTLQDFLREVKQYS